MALSLFTSIMNFFLPSLTLHPHWLEGPGGDGAFVVMCQLLGTVPGPG